MRIVSLVPAATEIAFALGSGDDVVAVTHDCDYPEAARALPRVTRSTIPAGTSSRDIDVAVRAAAAEGDSTFHVDASALADARPDILLGQTLCRVCAVTVSQLPSVMDPSPEILPLDGDSIAGIFDDIERVGEAIGRAREAASFVASLRERIDRVRERVAGLPHPTVVALEWVDPLFSAGHWVPEQVAAAGGVELIGRANARSKEISLDDVVAADPDYVLILPCGFDAERAARESRVLIADERWTQLRAVRDGHVLTLDGNAYFSRPGPRVVDGIELLASALHGKVPARVV
ncbi:MAG: cobalamin-binding protein [Chloroflexi bacterium]|nr:MAG: cobalamin-binding protein [Chloroflexota bacterium]